MVFPIAGGNESKGYEISNSLRFNDADSPHLTRTPSSSGNRRTWTMSCWFKKCEDGLNHTLFSTTGTQDIRFASNERLLVYGESKSIFNTNRLFRDPSAWYHIVVACDTTQSTASNRVKLYVNGTQETDFETNSQPSQNYDWNFNHTVEQGIGERVSTGGLNPHGYLADFHWIDGQQLDPTYFGETNDNGVWIPIKYTGTYGTNGFFMEFQQTGTSANSSGIGADTSGNDNHLTPANLAATDITEDTPTNNFCTWNPLNTAVGGYYTNTLLQGNLQCSSGGFGATFDMPSGKWYWEVRCNSSDADQAVGAMSVTESGQTSLAGDTNPTHGFIYQANGNARRNGTVEETWSTFTNGDIIGFSYDADNRILKGYKNNSLAGDITLTDSGDSYTPTVTALGGNFIANFGQEGSFAGTVTAQGNSDGKYGNFYYAPPSGYYALCTKRLAEFG